MKASVLLSFSLSSNKICVQIKRADESAELFVDNQKELELLPSTIRSDSVPIESPEQGRVYERRCRVEQGRVLSTGNFTHHVADDDDPFIVLTVTKFSIR